MILSVRAFKSIRLKCVNLEDDHFRKVAFAKEQILVQNMLYNCKKCIKCDLKSQVEHFGTNCSIEEIKTNAI